MSGSGPIYEYQREVTAQLEQALRERDEARAEVERLHATNHASAIRGLQSWLKDAICERDEARAEVERLKAELERTGVELWGAQEALRDINPVMEQEFGYIHRAYQRGAEAMREAGRQLLVREWIHASQRVVELFVALPVPEDKQ